MKNSSTCSIGRSPSSRPVKNDPVSGWSVARAEAGSGGATRGEVVIHAGYDAYIEEFVGLAQAFRAAGFDVVMFDGPGQGSTLMREGIPMTPDWAAPVGAALDRFAIDDATLIGISLGGCLAVRAAASNPASSA